MKPQTATEKKLDELIHQAMLCGARLRDAKMGEWLEAVDIYRNKIKRAINEE